MLALIRNFMKPTYISNFGIYPYEFCTSGYACVDKIRFLIEEQSEWDYCYDPAESLNANDAAALRFGFKSPFSDEETALCQMLTHVHAGPHITTYAWGLYADIIKSETQSH